MSETLEETARALFKAWFVDFLPVRAKMEGRWKCGQTPPRAGTARPQAVAARARAIITEVERHLGYEPVDRKSEHLGYDIESRASRTGRLRFIEVKGRASGAEAITVTRNKILTALNKPESYILAIVEFLENGGHRVYYIRRLFWREPDFGPPV